MFPLLSFVQTFNRRRLQMDPTCPTPSARTLHCALELSKKSWLLAIQFPDRPQPSLYAIEGGNTEKLMARLTAARDCWAKMSGAVPAITVCYEVGYDAFWLARFLEERGVECLVRQGTKSREVWRGQDSEGYGDLIFRAGPDGGRDAGARR